LNKVRRGLGWQPPKAYHVNGIGIRYFNQPNWLPCARFRYLISADSLLLILHRLTSHPELIQAFCHAYPTIPTGAALEILHIGTPLHRSDLLRRNKNTLVARCYRQPDIK